MKKKRETSNEGICFMISKLKTKNEEIQLLIYWASLIKIICNKVWNEYGNDFYGFTGTKLLNKMKDKLMYWEEFNFDKHLWLKFYSIYKNL
jgi:hypothetical protein